MAGRLGGLCLAAAFSRVGLGRTGFAAAQFPPAPPANPRQGPPTRPCGGRTPRETRSNLPVDALRQAWQDGAAMNESEKQFSFTRAASSTSGRAKKQILISQRHPILVPGLRHPRRRPQRLERPRHQTRHLNNAQLPGRGGRFHPRSGLDSLAPNCQKAPRMKDLVPNILFDKQGITLYEKVRRST